MVLHLRAYAEKDRYISSDSPAVFQSTLAGFVVAEEKIDNDRESGSAFTDKVESRELP